MQRPLCRQILPALPPPQTGLLPGPAILSSAAVRRYYSAARNRKHMDLPIPLTVLLVLAPLGCAKLAREPGFADIQRDAEQRTGARVHWNQGVPDDHLVDQSVRHPSRAS